jgi:molecular chaperone DnaK
LEEKEKGLMWPEVKAELTSSFYELEELLEKIKSGGHDENLNMEVVNLNFSEIKSKVEGIIREELIKEARELIQEINSIDFNIRNAVTGNAMDVQFLNHFNDTFNSVRWTNPTRARQLINQGLQLASEGRTGGIRNILVEVIGLMPADQRPDTLG